MGLALDRNIRNHQFHERLIDQRALKGAAISRVLDGLGQGTPDNGGRTDRRFQPRQVGHLDQGRNAAAFLADLNGACSRYSISDEALERLPSLSFRR